MKTGSLWTKAEDDLLMRGLKVTGRSTKACEKRRARLRAKGVNIYGPSSRNQPTNGLPPMSQEFTNATLTESAEITDDTQVISLPKTRIKTLEELIDTCEVDTSVWAVERFVCNKWEMGAVVDGEPVVEELYQVKAWFKRKVSRVDATVISDIKEDMKTYAPRYATPRKEFVQCSGRMLEVSVFDHHFGKLAWHEETGTDYDIDIATELFHEAVDHLMETAGNNYERILFPIGNDILQFDNLQGTTTAGTKVDTDSRFPKVYRVVRKILVETIDKLRKIAPVDVIVVPGNHDRISSFCLGDAIECWYHACNDVTVNNDAVVRKYYHWGDCLLGFTHGYGTKEKAKDLPIIMATENPTAWGSTKYREWHTGHLHQERVTEVCGVKTRILPSLCATDAWHKENGYVQNQRTAQAFVWNKSNGLEAVLSFNL